MFEKVTIDDQRFALAVYFKGNCYLGFKDIENAKKCFEKAIRLNPNNPGAYVGLAGCEFHFKNQDKSL